MRYRLLTLTVVLAGAVASAAGEFDAEVRIENRTGEDQTNWPVFLTVWKVFGGNLNLADLNPNGFHVFGPNGAEVPHMLRRIPPEFSLGNDEIVFLVPKLTAGASLTYRITNTSAPGKTARIDLAGNPKNLLPNGGFEEGDGVPAGYRAAANKGARISFDAAVRHGGRRSLLLTLPVNSSATLRTVEPIAFKKDGRYHFSIWARSENVAYNGYGFWNSGVSIRFEPTALRGRSSLTVRGDRQWYCYRFEPGGADAWGVPDFSSRAQTEKVRKGRGGRAAAEIWAKAGGKAAFVISARQQNQPFLKGDKTGRVWIDEALLFAQPAVTVERRRPLDRIAKNGAVIFARPVDMPRWGPSAHEAVERIEVFAMPGERRQIRFGIYATKPLENVTAFPGRPGGDWVEGWPGRYATYEWVEAEERLNEELETLGPFIEGEGKRPMVWPKKLPRLDAGKWVEYLYSIEVPRGRKPGVYPADVTLHWGDKKTPRKHVPITLRVLPFEAPKMEGYWVGGIYNIGYDLKRDEAFYRCYAKTRFNYLMLFDYLIGSMEGDKIDFAAAQKQVDQIVKIAKVTGGIGLYREPNMSEDQPRKWYQIASGTNWGGKYAHGTDAKFKAGYQKLARQAHEYARKHDWPTLIYMVSDEPGNRRDVHPSMGWLNEAIPEAITCADVQFKDMLRTWQWYNLPVLDDPVDWTGPLVYEFVRKRKGRFGFCGTGWSLDVGRYQPGLMLASSGACYWHFWHTQGPFRPKGNKVIRSHAVAAMSAGFNDLRYYVALKQAIDQARKSGKAAQAAEAEKYLAEVFRFAIADHDRHLMPYNGVPWMWGYARFYDDWRARMKDFILMLRK